MDQSIKKTAGRMGLQTDTRGWPLWCRLSVDGEQLEKPDGGGLHLRPEDMRDLRHCIDRVLAQLPPDSV